MENETDDDFKALEPISKLPIAPAHVIASLALNMAMKYHDINIVRDGTLYQQYKLEGRNMQNLDLDLVFETAIKIEAHLLRSSERIAQMLIEAIQVEVVDDQPKTEEVKA